MDHIGLQAEALRLRQRNRTLAVSESNQGK